MCKIIGSGKTAHVLCDKIYVNGYCTPVSKILNFMQSDCRIVESCFYEFIC